MHTAHIPYSNTELVPIISSETIDFHYGKHHCGYANTLNQLITDTEFAPLTLEEIIIKSQDNNIKIFNNASQLFNHDFYWQCLGVSKNYNANKMTAIAADQFKSFDAFLDEYISFANTMFGSGWSWLIHNNEGLSFINTQNAGTSIGLNGKALCVVDLWEHAYYIDYRNNRLDYITKTIKNCINWDFCEGKLCA